jgi:hypothetical protein
MATNFSKAKMYPQLAVKTWYDMLETSSDAKINFLQIVNTDNSSTANVCLAIQTSADAFIDNPSGLAITTSGTAGTTIYDYFVTAVNSNNKETAPSNLVEITTGNATLSSSNYNTLTWTAVDGAVKYRLYCRIGGSTSSVIKVAEITGAVTYNDTGVMSSTGSVPWINLTGVTAILAWSGLAPGTGMDALSRPLTIPSSDKLMIYTTGSISYYLSGEK